MKPRPIDRTARILFALRFCFACNAICTKAQSDRGLGLSEKAVKSLPSTAKRYAIVIGVDQYADTQITTLGGASNDAKALAKALVQYAGFPSEQVTLLASDQPAERQPTHGNILRRLSNMAAVIPPDRSEERRVGKECRSRWS